MDNEPLVRMVGGSAVETVVSHDIIGRLMIQCARQPGLATVWEQLMGFDGGCSHDGLQGLDLTFTEESEGTVAGQDRFGGEHNAFRLGSEAATNSSINAAIGQSTGLWLKLLLVCIL